MTASTMLEKSNFIYLEEEEIWSCNPPDSDLEILIVGDHTGPDQEHIKCADRVLSELEILFESASSLLAEYIDYKKLNSDGNWQLESIEFGRGVMGITEPGSFEMLLTLEADTVGLWSVGFRISEQADDFFPHQFSRAGT